MVTSFQMGQRLQTWYVVKELGFLVSLNGRTYLIANVCSSSSSSSGGGGGSSSSSSMEDRVCSE
jgi:hypothetical protein